MNIQCPHCGKAYQLQPEHIGKNVTCPSCQMPFTVANPNLIPCPDCFELVSRRAAVCPHCGAPINCAYSPAAISRDAGENLPEETVMELHPASRYFILSICLGILLTPAIIGIFILITTYISIHYTVYRLTTKRIIVQTGFFSRAQAEIWIKDMRSVNMVQDFWGRIIGTGSVSIGTAATAGTEIQMVGLANPQEVIDKINSLRHQ